MFMKVLKENEQTNYKQTNKRSHKQNSTFRNHRSARKCYQLRMFYSSLTDLAVVTHPVQIFRKKITYFSATVGVRRNHI